jgi:predicted cupin superfamily sugar epimerase
MNKQEIVERLGLIEHFEGGYFRETFRADGERFATPRGARSTMTSIYYMLADDSPVDAFHTKHSDGIQFYQMGAPLTYHLIHSDGRYEKVVLGPNLAAGEQLQLAVKVAPGRLPNSHPANLA